MASFLGWAEDQLRRALGTLGNSGYVESVMRGTAERRQYRWFLTRKPVDALYLNGHRITSTKEEARIVSPALRTLARVNSCYGTNRPRFARRSAC